MPHQDTLRFICTELPCSGNTSTVEHITGTDGTPLCGCRAEGKTYDIADWEALHSPRWHKQCPKCRQAALLILRPRAVYWYLDPFSGHLKEFRSLRSAKASARKEHGNSTIYQLGPGDINRIAAFVEGMDPLP